MAERLSRTVDMQEEMIRVLLANGQAIMNLARELELTPREVRNILQETLMQFGEPDQVVSDRIPIAAHPPQEMKILSPGEIRLLVGKSQN